MEAYLTTEILLSFFTLSLLEIVLGIDNLIFITLVADGLPEKQRAKARFIGLSLALVIRILMLLGIAWIMSLTKPLFSVMELDISIKDMLLIVGGMFLIGKATFEMHADLGGMDEKKGIVARSTFFAAIAQIVFIDTIFSFDSIITAVGLTDNIPVIIAAITVSMVVMMFTASSISRFLHAFPTFKMLALSFILMIGTMLVADGLHFHVPKGYIYFAFGFSIFTELLNTIASRRRKKKKIKQNQ